MIKGKKTVILGFGAMGGSLARGWVQKRLIRPSDLWAVDSDPSRLVAGRRLLRIRTGTASEALPGASLILLAVKPQQMKELLSTIRDLVPRRALVVTIAAGVSTAQVERSLPQGCPVVRVMPNTPSQLGEGMSAVAAGGRSGPSHLRAVLRLFEAVGQAVEVREEWMDLVTGISGSGPAYLYLFIEALVESGVKRGLPPPLALQLAAQTALGASRMVLETGRNPAELRAQVSSPGGTTLAGLKVLEERGFKGILDAAITAAVERAAELRRMNG